MRIEPNRYLVAAIAVAIFPVGARADTTLGLTTSPQGSPKSQPTRNACGRPDVAARLTAGMPIDVSPFDAIGRPHGSASVAVTLAADGTLLRAAVLHSSGNARFDESALHAIRQSTFAPEQRNCGKVGGTYQVEADATADAE